MKTSELTGAALDWAVAEAANADAHTVSLYRHGKTLTREDTDALEYWAPSVNWVQGGPIIEREIIDINGDPNGKGIWQGRCFVDGKQTIRKYGPTPLIAAMRCYVASKLGEEVDVPEELK